MRQRIIAAALALCSAGVTAAPTVWDFSYQGFHDRQDDVYLPGLAFAGSFSGEDLDGDGALSLAELISFTIPYGTVAGQNWTACGFTYPINYTCQLDRFSYSAQGLDIGGSINSFDVNAGFSESYRIDSGVGWERSIASVRTGQSQSWRYDWTGQTTAAVIPAIPEPRQAAMLLTGLVPLALLAWRRRPGAILSTTEPRGSRP